MHVSRFDLNLLRLFEAVYSGGGVTRAAEMLNLTQPAVSHALNRLRDQVGDPLFVRLGQGLTPTPAAHRLIGPVRRSLGEIDRAVKDIESFDVARADTRFRLGFNALMEEPLFPIIASTVIAEASGVRLESVRYDRSDIAVALASSQLDAVVDIEMPTGEMIQNQKIASGSLIAIARADHPIFAEGRGAVSLDEYMALRHVAVSTRPRGPSFEDISITRSTTFRRNIAARCQMISSALQLVRQTDLVMTVAAPFINRSNLGDGLRVFCPPLELPEANIHLYWHASNDTDRAHLWLRQTISDALTRNLTTSETMLLQ